MGVRDDDSKIKNIDINIRIIKNGIKTMKIIMILTIITMLITMYALHSIKMYAMVFYSKEMLGMP